jgi:hypothetical protein
LGWALLPDTLPKVHFDKVPSRLAAMLGVPDCLPRVCAWFLVTRGSRAGGAYSLAVAGFLTLLRGSGTMSLPMAATASGSGFVVDNSRACYLVPLIPAYPLGVVGYVWKDTENGKQEEGG